MSKYLMLGLAFFALSVSPSFAQSSNLKGPAAKNSKAWETTRQVPVTTHNYVRVTGPAAKNNRPNATTEGNWQVPIRPARSMRLTGPAAKNARWRKRPEW